MRAQRNKTGFHRIGAICAVVFGVPGGLSVVSSVPVYLQVLPPNPDPELWQILLASGIAGLVLAGVAYLWSWALGWIVAGVAGDGEESSQREVDARSRVYQLSGPPHLLGALGPHRLPIPVGDDAGDLVDAN